MIARVLVYSQLCLIRALIVSLAFGLLVLMIGCFFLFLSHGCVTGWEAMMDTMVMGSGGR
jgi:hypothetical protein